MLSRLSTSVARGAFQQTTPVAAAAMKFSNMQNRGFKVVVCGGAGGIGQPLSLLMASSGLVKELVVQDVTMAMVPSEGVAADLSHIETDCKLGSFGLDPSKPAIDQLGDVLTGTTLVLVPAGVPRKPGMTRDDLFKINAGIAKGLIEACAQYCPGAMLGLIINPVNSIVPAMCEIYKKKGLDPLKICGVTTLDVVRANKFVGEAVGADPALVNIPVIGGHAGKTILPLFSQDTYGAKMTADQVAALDPRTQDAGTEVVNAKAGKGSATLSMAYAGAKFGKAVLRGLAGEPNVVECSYVASTVTELPYFASKVTFGKSGVEKIHELGPMNAHESARFVEAKAQLKDEIDKGLEFAAL
jgi:malate dehydrogenase